MKILTDWLYTKTGLHYRHVEYTEEEWASAIPLMEFLRVSKQDFPANKDLSESKQGR